MLIRNNLELRILKLRLKLLLLYRELIKELIAVLSLSILLTFSILGIGIITALLAVAMTILTIAMSAVLGKLFTILFLLIVEIDFVNEARKLKNKAHNKLVKLQIMAIKILIFSIVEGAILLKVPDRALLEVLKTVALAGLIVATGTLGISVKFEQMRIERVEKKNASDGKSLGYNLDFVEKVFENIAPTTWTKTRDSYFDTFEAFPNELEIWKKRNLKYIAYFIAAWDLFGFFRYFTKTLISNAIATRRVSG